MKPLFIANAMAIITGTAAPVSVLGLAASIHAFRESFFTSISKYFRKTFAKVLKNHYICKRNKRKVMLKNTASLDLVEFIETQILPRYAEFDRAHNLEHVTRVIRRSLELARQTGADINMAYTIAAYHDLGMSGPRAVHHITGGKILAGDARLKRWFSPEQIKIMKEAVEDHRASASHAPRSLYGKIVAEADRDIVPEVVFQRTVQFGMANYPEKNKEEHWQRFCQHMEEKYSNHGYIRLWIPGSPNEQKLKELRNIIADKTLLRKQFEKYYSEEL